MKIKLRAMVVAIFILGVMPSCFAHEEINHVHRVKSLSAIAKILGTTTLAVGVAWACWRYHDRGSSQSEEYTLDTDHIAHLTRVLRMSNSAWIHQQTVMDHDSGEGRQRHPDALKIALPIIGAVSFVFLGCTGQACWQSGECPDCCYR